MSYFNTLASIVVDNFPEKLFKYHNTKLEYIEEIIIENKLFFSSPSSFNDPFDCKICMDKKGTKKEKKDMAKRLIKEQLPAIDKYKLNKAANKLIKEGELSKKLLSNPNEHINRSGICCLTTRNDNLLMWSHYANSHTGLCFEFSPIKKDIFAYAQPVRYSTKRPKWKVFKHNDYDESITNVIHTKSEKWAYEEEWRIWMHNFCGHRQFMPSQLTGLIFGCKADKKFIVGVTKMTENLPHPIKLYKAVEHPDNFSLRIEAMAQS